MNDIRNYHYSLYNDQEGPFLWISGKAKGKAVDDLVDKFGPYLQTVHLAQDDGETQLLYKDRLNDPHDPITVSGDEV